MLASVVVSSINDTKDLIGALIVGLTNYETLCELVPAFSPYSAPFIELIETNALPSKLFSNHKLS